MLLDEAPPVLEAEPAAGADEEVVVLEVETAEAAGTPNVGWLAVLPALFAIGAALLFRQVIIALFLGVWLGAWIVTGDLAMGWFTGLFTTIQTYILAALADDDHAAIILFSMMIGGTVGLIQKNGGTAAIVETVTKWAQDSRAGASSRRLCSACSSSSMTTPTP